ncbi:MAG: class I SAM-dependent methyltransferase [Vicinamibacterales bacterium]
MTFLHRLIELQHRAWSVAFRSALLPVGSLFRQNDRHLTWRLWEASSGANRPGVYPEVSLGAILSVDSTVTLQALPNQTYNVTELELLAISAIVRQRQALVALEFGTADGRTTLNIAVNAAPGGTVFTLNLPLQQAASPSADVKNGTSWHDSAGHKQDVPVGFHFLNRETPASIVQLWGNSQSFDFAPYLGKCEMVFVDGDHFEPGVSIDCETALMLVDRRDSVVLWHDALRYDVQTALPRLARRDGLPIHLISGTNLAALFFLDGQAVEPAVWQRRRRG